MKNRPGIDPALSACGAAVFLVLEDDALVAADIEGSLQSAGKCRVIRVNHQRDIVPSLMREARITAAILGMPYARVVESGVHRDLASRGARIILTVDEEDEDKVTRSGWRVLPKPFTDLMILDAVGISLH